MLKLTRAQQRRLADLVDLKVRRTLLGDGGVPRAANLLEAIGATVSSALPASGDAWRDVLRPLGVRLNLVGAFSFGCPKVDVVIGSRTRRCDLGSLLLVVDDLRRLVGDRRALLVSLRLSGDEADPVQRRLYSEWPAFQLADSAYGADLRNLRSSIDDPPGRFAQIDLARKEPRWSLIEPSGGIVAHKTLGVLLAAMTVGRAGRTAIVGGPDAWSQTVRELLNRTALAAVGGLRSLAGARSATTYEGEAGSGFVVLENRVELPLESALALTADRGMKLAEGPISVAHVMLRRA
jgi:hypothetical protein